VDGNGVPVSSDPNWNACIRRRAVILADGSPFNCSRYEDDGQWVHPDLGITFRWNDENKYLGLPDGYAATVTPDPVVLPGKSGEMSSSSASSAQEGTPADDSGSSSAADAGQ
jgi:hypothetical protein